MSTGGSEYRRAKRRKVDESIDVLDTMTEIVVGHLSDLSETGMLLILSQPLVSDALYQFRFKLRDARGDERAVMVGAHELWSDHSSCAPTITMRSRPLPSASLKRNW